MLINLVISSSKKGGGVRKTEMIFNITKMLMRQDMPTICVIFFLANLLKNIMLIKKRKKKKEKRGKH